MTNMPKNRIKAVKNKLKDWRAERYAKANIMPKIDGLIDKHKDGTDITKKEVEGMMYSILEKMVDDKVLTKEQFLAYTKPENNSMLSSALDSSKLFKEGKLESPKFTSDKDQLRYAAYKVFSKCGLGKLAMICRSEMSPESKAALNKAEGNMAKLTAEVIGAAKSIGSKVEGLNTLADDVRIGTKTENIVKNRAKATKGTGGHSR
jgi:hypothetical protein